MLWFFCSLKSLVAAIFYVSAWLTLFEPLFSVKKISSVKTSQILMYPRGISLFYVKYSTFWYI